MDMRAKITAALKDAMKAKDATRLSTLRLINAAIKDLDIAKRTEGSTVGDADVLALHRRRGDDPAVEGDAEFGQRDRRPDPRHALSDDFDSCQLHVGPQFESLIGASGARGSLGVRSVGTPTRMLTT